MLQVISDTIKTSLYVAVFILVGGMGVLWLYYKACDLISWMKNKIKKK